MSLGLSRVVHTIQVATQVIKRVALPLSSVDPSDQCRICLEDYSDHGCKPVQLDCGHVFGEKCLVDWVQESNNAACPYCRQEMMVEGPLHIKVLKWLSQFRAFSEPGLNPLRDDSLMYGDLISQHTMDLLKGQLTVGEAWHLLKYVQVELVRIESSAVTGLVITTLLSYGVGKMLAWLLNHLWYYTGPLIDSDVSGFTILLALFPVMAFCHRFKPYVLDSFYMQAYFVPFILNGCMAAAQGFGVAKVGSLSMLDAYRWLIFGVACSWGLHTVAMSVLNLLMIALGLLHHNELAENWNCVVARNGGGGATWNALM
ncbi:hypothetical protein M011DRAFT_51694 [Sporormia fimetaria CBS 119925]|uniref:RING-type domain-containing protein n=1 Tax=Sporormia fimetaria CBS 119925 TaxID=1340428 RepID=A0A6A6VDE4_9PLEO|nr:hypothetical protein M011DRAFT_51694 [Sporormia fimetaria CBS 119925]